MSYSIQTAQQLSDSEALQRNVCPVLLTAFVSPQGKGGNPCQLYFHPQPVVVDSGQPKAAATNTNKNISSNTSITHYNTVVTNCHSWSQATNQRNSLVVQCYNSQGLIQCCGHGLLCAAYWCLLRQPEQTLTLLMNGSQLTADCRDQRIWLHLSRLPTHRCQPPDWASKLFPDRPIAAATAGGEQGYLILQWPEDYPLQQLPPPDQLLAQHSQRALIVTAANTLLPDIDIQFRYFAPQYGSNEDLATGSAMRLLADYWQQNQGHKQHQLSALQCSASTGTLYSRIENNTISVGGYCRQGYQQ